MNKIKELRKEKNISQTKLASIVGVVRSAMCQYESGARQVPDDIKLKLADFFNVSVDYLLGRVAKEIIIIPDSLNGIPVAFAGGISDLTQDDIDDIARYVEFIRAKKTKK